VNDEWKKNLEGNGHNLYRDAVRNFFSDNTEGNHEGVRQCSFPLSQDFERKIKAPTPIVPPTRLVIRNLFPNNLVLHFEAPLYAVGIRFLLI